MGLIQPILLLSSIPLGEGETRHSFHLSFNNSKRKQIQPPNLAYPFLINFARPDQTISLRFRWVGRKWRQRDIMICRFLSKIVLHWNLQEVSFEDKTKWFSPKDANWRGLLKLCLGFWIFKVLYLKNISHCFCFPFSQVFLSIFHKTESMWNNTIIYNLWVDILENGWVLTFWMPKRPLLTLFQAILASLGFSVFLRIGPSKQCFRVIFLVLYENLV